MPSLYAVMSEEKDRQSERIRKLQEENEQLKEAREYYQENFLTMKTERNQFKRENEQLKQFQDTVFVLINEMIETANHYRTPIKSLDYGDDLGYWNGVYQKLKELREILEKEKGDVE